MNLVALPTATTWSLGQSTGDMGRVPCAPDGTAGVGGDMQLQQGPRTPVQIGWTNGKHCGYTGHADVQLPR